MTLAANRTRWREISFCLLIRENGENRKNNGKKDYGYNERAKIIVKLNIQIIIQLIEVRSHVSTSDKVN